MIKHTYLWKNGEQKTKSLTGMTAIRAKCLECSGFSTVDVRDCPIVNCALYPFRLGKYPKSKKDSRSTEKL